MTPAAEVPAGRPPVRVFARENATPLGLIFGGVGAATGVAIALLGLDHLPFTFCGLKAFTGLPCPTCGTTRAVGRLARLDPAGALAMNPMMAVAALAVALWALADLALLPGRRALAVQVSPGVARLLRIAIVAGVLLNWVYLIVAGR